MQDPPEPGPFREPIGSGAATELHLERVEPAPVDRLKVPPWQRRGPVLGVAAGLAALAVAGAHVLVIGPVDGADRLSAAPVTKTTPIADATPSLEPAPDVSLPTAEPPPVPVPVPVEVGEVSPSPVAAVAALPPSKAPAPVPPPPPPPVAEKLTAAPSSTITVEVENRALEEVVLRVVSGPDTTPGVVAVPPGERRTIRYEPDPNTYVGIHGYPSAYETCGDHATLSTPRPTGSFEVVIVPIESRNPGTCPVMIDLRRPDGSSYPGR